jgi:hypothetical protein
MEPIALHVDVQKSDQELNKAIKARCSGFGGVRSVQIRRSPKLYALVEMATLYHARQLASQYGGSTFGKCVLVHLEPISQVA